MFSKLNFSFLPYAISLNLFVTFIIFTELILIVLIKLTISFIILSVFIFSSGVPKTLFKFFKVIILFSLDSTSLVNFNN